MTHSFCGHCGLRRSPLLDFETGDARHRYEFRLCLECFSKAFADAFATMLPVLRMALLDKYTRALRDKRLQRKPLISVPSTGAILLERDGTSIDPTFNADPKRAELGLFAADDHAAQDQRD